ncbi:MAG TPA: tetratricopeptide repeat protein [Drouetiella sp.]|jgi:tetratricopeptide (TPR) repeat protein
MQNNHNNKKLAASFILSMSVGALCSAPALSRTFSTYEQALEDIDREQYQAAEMKLKKLIAQNPKDADAHAELARIYMDMNQSEQAISEATRAIEADPRIVRAYSIRTYCEFQRNRMKEGFADSTKVINFYTINPYDWSIWHAHKNRAQAYKILHQTREYAAERPNSEIFDELHGAEEAREAGRLDVAASKVTAALKLNPKAPDLWFFRGVINSNQGQFAESITDFNRAISFAPNFSPMLYYFRADSYQQLGKHQQAIDDLTKVIQAKPRLVAYRFVCETGRLRNELMRDDTVPISLGDVYVLRAQSYAALKKNSLAGKDLAMASKLDPTDDKAIAKEAELTLGLGKFDKAIKDYTKSVAANPKDWTRYKERADAYMQVGKTKEALADYSEVIKLTPEEPGAYMLRAVALKSMKRYDEAIADLSKVLELRNDDDDAYMERSECYRVTHRYKEALTDLDKAATLAHASKTYVREARIKVVAEMNRAQAAERGQEPGLGSATAPEKQATTAGSHELASEKQATSAGAQAPASEKQANSAEAPLSAQDEPADLGATPVHKSSDGSKDDYKNLFLIVIIGATLLLLGLIAAKKSKS